MSVRRLDPIIKFSPAPGSTGEDKRWVVTELMPQDPTTVYHIGDIYGSHGNFRLHLNGRDTNKWANDYKEAALHQLGIVAR